MPVISVIVPVYNVEPWLPENLDSILAQRFKDFELIVVNDGSTDGCPEICDRYSRRDSRVQVIHKKNGGLSSARNAGLDQARGEFIAFVDADDVVLPDFLGDLYELITREKADIAICGVEDVTMNGSSLPAPARTLPIREGCFNGDELMEQFYGPASTYYTVAWNKLYRARLWKNFRYPEGRIHEDDAVAHVLFHESSAIACSARTLYRYRMRDGSICRTDFTPARFDGVTALVMRCQYMAQQGLSPTLRDKALAACWHRYLSLCAQARHQPPELIYPRWREEQMRMCTLLSALPGCRELTLREKISCLLWSARGLPSDKKKAKS